METYKTELRNKNRGYMNLIVWQKAMELFQLVWKITYVEAKIDFERRSPMQRSQFPPTLRKDIVGDPSRSTSSSFMSRWDRRRKR